MSQMDGKSSTPSSPTAAKNSTPVPSSPDVINKAATKLCHIVKRPDFDGYGFNLHSEKAKPGQFIGKVDANSPAEMAGLKEGDRIIEVNGTPINNETHKQVVQRIKAIACEVRLLLVDVEGKGDGRHLNGNTVEISKTEQVLPGASENINSITMVSTKRASQESPRSSSSTLTANGNGLDVTDKSVSTPPPMSHDQQIVYNNNNVPPPPSATVATVPKMSQSSSTSYPSSSTPLASPTTTTSTSSSNGGAGSENGNVGGVAPPSTTIKAGSLNLPMTAAEMRAKLMSKKKYDPKNETVDLKKKYEIVQKL